MDDVEHLEIPSFDLGRETSAGELTVLRKARSPRQRPGDRAIPVQTELRIDSKNLTWRTSFPRSDQADGVDSAGPVAQQNRQIISIDQSITIQVCNGLLLAPFTKQDGKVLRTNGTASGQVAYRGMNWFK